MSTSQQFLVCDNSSAANYKAWAQAVSNWIRTCGWTNSTDTGQLNGAGGNNWAGVSTAPASAAYYYEIFQPGDGLTNFYLKVEYGNTGSGNVPGMRWSIGTSTNGAGTLTGSVTTLVNTGVFGNAAPSTTTTYECNFSGTSGRLSIMMWRNTPLSGSQSSAQIFAVQRSLNSSGTPTGTYVTLWTVGSNGSSSSAGSSSTQQSLHFTAGPGPLLSNRSTGTASGYAVIGGNFGGISSAFNGGIPLANSSPCVGVWDYPCTVIAAAGSVDITEGVPFSVTNQYGQTITYMPSKAGAFLYATLAYPASTAVCMEYD